MKLELVKIKDLKLDPRNARLHNEKNLDAIAGSLKDFKQQKNIVISEDGVVVAGNGTVTAALRAGASQIWAYRTPLDKKGQKAYALADNRAGELATWDDAVLKEILQELKDEEYNVEDVGFDLDEFGLSKNDGLTPEDEVPDVRGNIHAVSKGDLWHLGNHRLACGDSTNLEDVRRLMGGELADMVFTDPPYNVAYSGLGQNDLGTIENDDMSDEDFDGFLDRVFLRYQEALKPLGLIYVCHPDSASPPKIAFEQAFARYFHKSSTIIWMKQSAGMGWQDYRCQHEPILYGWKEGDGKHYFCGDRTKTTVWQIGRDAQASYVHPTQKPVALIEEALANSSQSKELVLDMFGGSGSTLIACEKTNRKCYGMEIDPHYCSVIIERWQQFTGKQAILVSNSR